jgi:hypothetical protein
MGMKKQLEYLRRYTDWRWVIIKGVRHRAQGIRKEGGKRKNRAKRGEGEPGQR